jgi:hypothetical protein
MQKTFCDMCNKDLSGEQIKTVLVNHPTVGNIYEHYDFCASCEQRFRDFLATKRPQRLDTAAGK